MGVDFVQKTLDLIADDAWRVECLHALAELDLSQGAIAAGFVRNAIWDAIFCTNTRLLDVDVVYFDASCDSLAQDEAYERRLGRQMNANWQVRNQARMHRRNQVAPYLSVVDAVAHFPESATCLSVRMERAGGLSMPNQEGLVDAWHGVLRPNPLVRGAKVLLMNRTREKNWLAQWPGLVLQAN